MTIVAMTTLWRRVLVAALIGALLLAPAAPSSAQSADATVTMTSEAFNPVEAHVAPGQTVVWKNPNFLTHTVTADDSSFDSGDLGTGKQFTMSFDTPGSYPYYCQYHGGPGGEDMSGVIVVDG